LGRHGCHCTVNGLVSCHSGISSTEKLLALITGNSSRLFYAEAGGYSKLPEENITALFMAILTRTSAT